MDFSDIGIGMNHRLDIGIWYRYRYEFWLSVSGMGMGMNFGYRYRYQGIGGTLPGANLGYSGSMLLCSSLFSTLKTCCGPKILFWSKYLADSLI